MTTTRISFLGITHLSARASHVTETHWVNLYTKGEMTELVTFFFQDAATAERFAAGINAAFTPHHYVEEQTDDTP